MPVIKIKKKEKNGKIIKITALPFAVIIVIGAFVIWLTDKSQNSDLNQTRLSAYNGLSSLVEKILSAPNTDSLISLSKTFNHDFYEGEKIPNEDSLILLTMKRFKFDLADKINGSTNILDPKRFEKIGHDVVHACQLQIAKLNNIPKEQVKN
ncbi:MAG TPA: hypothetical protein VK787_09475 [Puia sp.]|jgi:hypothetical protein|nr:hypothetical protein [Puia sp.]